MELTNKNDSTTLDNISEYSESHLTKLLRACMNLKLLKK